MIQKTKLFMNPTKINKGLRDCNQESLKNLVKFKLNQINCKWK